MDNGYDFITQTDEGCRIAVKLVPGSSVSKIADFCGEFIRIKISAPPLENRANKELISFLSDKTGINKSKIEIISGEKSKLKQVFIKTAKKDILVKNLCL